MRLLGGQGGAGLGGRLRTVPEDFLVEEIPLRPPSGRGEFLRVQVEKRAISTFEVLLFVSKAAKLSEQRIGYAGLKDSQAVARQYLTLPKVPPERMRGLVRDRFKVLEVARTDQPLRIGHLKGNRFTIRLRGVRTDRVLAARRMLERLVRDGLPNAYGAQRFGTRGDGHALGRAIVLEDWRGFVDQLLGRPHPAEHNPEVRAARAAYDRGDLDEAFQRFPVRHRPEKKALAGLRRGLPPRAVYASLGEGPRRIWVSAWQSYLFNRVLDARIAAGTQGRLLTGDVAWLTQSGACYPVRDAAAEAARAARFEASPTGPLVGHDLVLATGEPGAAERAVLAAEGVDPESFRVTHVKARGLRRPLRVPVEEASLEEEPGGAVVVRCLLPSGSFATVLLEHLMAPPAGSVCRDG